MFGKFIQQQRAKKNMTQEYLASELGISRPTYMQIERGERELTISEAKKLAAIFDMSLEDFLNGKDATRKITITGRKKTNRKKVEGGMRINIPQEKAEKFEQVLLYILKKIGGQPNVGQTMLYKLLYFIDFDYYEKYEENLMGATYIKNHHGPTSVELGAIMKEMQEQGEIEPVKSQY